jgi:hypothetical protein
MELDRQRAEQTLDPNSPPKQTALKRDLTSSYHPRVKRIRLNEFEDTVMSPCPTATDTLSKPPSPGYSGGDSEHTDEMGGLDDINIIGYELGPEPQPNEQCELLQ